MSYVIDLMNIENGTLKESKLKGNDILKLSNWYETSLKFHELEMCVIPQYYTSYGMKYNQITSCLVKDQLGNFRIESLEVLSQPYIFSNGSNITYENLQNYSKRKDDVILDWTKICFNKESLEAKMKFLACYIPANLGEFIILYNNTQILSLDSSKDDYFLVSIIKNGSPLFEHTFCVKGNIFKTTYNLLPFKNIDTKVNTYKEINNKYKKGPGSSVLDDWDKEFKDYIKVQAPRETRAFMYGCQHKNFVLGKMCSYVDLDYSSSGKYVTTYLELIYNNMKFCVCLTEDKTNYGICSFIIPDYSGEYNTLTGLGDFLEEACDKYWGENTNRLVSKITNLLMKISALEVR